MLKKAGIYGEAFASYLLALVCLLGSYLYFMDSRVKLEDSAKVVGIITHLELIDRPLNVAGKFKVPSKVLAFTVWGLNQTLAIKPEYKALLKEGDLITVYYKPLNEHRINVDIYQIEKRGTIILSLKNYSWRRIICVFLALTTGVYIATMQTFRLKRLLRQI